MFGRRRPPVAQKANNWPSISQLRISSLSHRSVVKLPASNVAGVVLCYLIGAYDLNVLLLVLVVLVMLSLWADSHEILIKTVELQTDTRLRRQRAIVNGESVNWTNRVINSWWTLCEPTVATFVKDWVEPLVDAMKVPGVVDSMEVTAFDPGIHRPVFSNIQILQTAPGSSGDIHEPVTLKNLFQSQDTNAPTISSFIAEVDCVYDCPTAVFEFNAFIGQKMFGKLQFNVDSFCLKGRLKCILTFSPNLPFPNVATMHLAFMGKPDVQFTCKMLSKSVELMDIPVVRDMTKEYISYTFNKLFVYPGGIHAEFIPPPEPICGSFPFQLAQGVLNVTICGSGAKPNTFGGNYYWSLRLGSQKCIRVMDASNRPWSSTFSFLVHNMQGQKLVVKLKTKKLLRAVTLETNDVQLEALGLHITEENNKPVSRTVGLSNKAPGTILDLIYTPLPPFSLMTPSSSLPNTSLAGVLYIHLHGAKDLVGVQLYGASNPICVVKDGEKTLLVTRRITNCIHPVWEQGVEMFIPNYKAMQLHVDVGNQITRFGLQDIVGTSHLDFSTSDISQIIQHRLPLQLKLPTGIMEAGSVFVSIVFRPVASVLNTVLSLKADYMTRTHRHSLANCLDLTTHMLNPSVQGSRVSYSETKLTEYCSDGEVCSDDSA